MPGLAVGVVLLLSGPAVGADAGVSPRDKVLIASDWRFKRGDPENLDVDLRYARDDGRHAIRS